MRALESSGTKGTTDADTERAACWAKLLGCRPIVISFARKTNSNDAVDVTGLFNKDNLDKLRAAPVRFANDASTLSFCGSQESVDSRVMGIRQDF